MAITTQSLERSYAAVFACVAVLLALAVAGCGGNPTSERTNHPDFLTPVAEAQDLGITPYWFGTDFQVDDLRFKISASTYFRDPARVPGGAGAEPGLGFLYGGAGLLDVQTFSASGGGAEVVRTYDMSLAGAQAEPAKVGDWDAEVLTLPLGDRPVNQLVVVVDVGDIVVWALASSGSTGVPGTDVNPLLDKDLLIEVVAEHLRPYPE